MTSAKIREMFVQNPESQKIADALNADGAEVCVHGRDPCFLRCGVQRRMSWEVIPRPWEPIPQIERLEWLED